MGRAQSCALKHEDKGGESGVLRDSRMRIQNLRVTNGLEEEMHKEASENEERACRWGEREWGREHGSREVSRTRVTEGNVRTGQRIRLKRASICLGARSCP